MTNFKCEYNRTDGWDDKVSFQISTQNKLIKRGREFLVKKLILSQMINTNY
jgi:hypothetical protein